MLIDIQTFSAAECAIGPLASATSNIVVDGSCVWGADFQALDGTAIKFPAGSTFVQRAVFPESGCNGEAVLFLYTKQVFKRPWQMPNSVLASDCCLFLCLLPKPGDTSQLPCDVLYCRMLVLQTRLGVRRPVCAATATGSLDI